MKIENGPKQVNEKARKEMYAKVGRRLRELRLQDNLRGNDIQKELLLPMKAMGRIEFGKGVDVENFIAILQYYIDKGHDLGQILSGDCAGEHKKEVGHLP